MSLRRAIHNAICGMENPDDGTTWIHTRAAGTLVVTETRDEIRRLMGLADPLTLADLDAAEAAP